MIFCFIYNAVGQESVLSEILRQPLKEDSDKVSIVFDIDETLCNPEAKYDKNYYFSRLAPGAIAVPFYEDNQYFAHTFFPYYGEVFLNILSWGWDIIFFSYASSYRNHNVIYIFLRFAFTPYSNDIDHDLCELMGNRIHIFSKFSTVPTKSLGSKDSPRKHEFFGLRKKHLAGIGLNPSNAILVDDNKSWAVGGVEYPWVNPGVFLYAFKNLKKPEFVKSLFEPELFKEDYLGTRDLWCHAPFILGLFKLSRDLMQKNKLSLREAVIEQLTIKKRFDLNKKSKIPVNLLIDAYGPCAILEDDIRFSDDGLEKAYHWLCEGCKDIIAMRNRKLNNDYNPNDDFYQAALNFYEQSVFLAHKKEFDISRNAFKKYFPGYYWDKLPNNTNLFILRHTVSSLGCFFKSSDKDEPNIIKILGLMQANINADIFKKNNFYEYVNQLFKCFVDVEIFRAMVVLDIALRLHKDDEDLCYNFLLNHKLWEENKLGECFTDGEMFSDYFDEKDLSKSDELGILTNTENMDLNLSAIKDKLGTPLKINPFDDLVLQEIIKQNNPENQLIMYFNNAKNKYTNLKDAVINNLNFVSDSKKMSKYIRKLDSIGFFSEKYYRIKLLIKVIAIMARERENYDHVTEPEYDIMQSLCRSVMKKIYFFWHSFTDEQGTNLLVTLMRAVDLLDSYTLKLNLRSLISQVFCTVHKKYEPADKCLGCSNFIALLTDKKVKFKYFYNPTHVVMPELQSSTPILFVRMLNDFFKGNNKPFVYKVIDSFTEKDHMQAVYVLDKLINKLDAGYFWTNDDRIQLEKNILKLINRVIAQCDKGKKKTIKFDGPLYSIRRSNENYSKYYSNLFGCLYKYKFLYWFLKLRGKGYMSMKQAPEYMLDGKDAWLILSKHPVLIHQAFKSAIGTDPKTISSTQKMGVKKFIFWYKNHVEALNIRSIFLDKFLNLKMFDIDVLGDLVLPEEDKEMLSEVVMESSSINHILDKYSAIWPNIKKYADDYPVVCISQHIKETNIKQYEYFEDWRTELAIKKFILEHLLRGVFN